MKISIFKASCVLLALVTFTLITARPSQAGPAEPEPPPPGSPLDKLSPWVLEHTADGQEAEFLVVLAEQADLSLADKLAAKAEKGRYVYQALWDTAQASQPPILGWLEAQGIPHRSYYIVNLIWVKADRATAITLAERPGVARLDGNPNISNFNSGFSGAEFLAAPQLAQVAPAPAPKPQAAPAPKPQAAPAPKPQAAPAPKPQAVESNITYVHADQVWAMGFTGQGIVVGGQDTGYDWDHPALKTHYRGWNGITATHDYNWHDSIHTSSGVCGANSTQPCDDHGHGTHTMGTLVGDDGGSNQIGMAPGAQWIGCRNMNAGVGTPATYLECFEFFLAPYPVGGTPAQGNPDLAPDVTNNSWTCPTSEGCALDTLQAAVEAQRAAGIMTVVAAGNSGASGCSTVSEPPAIYDAAYSVGALQKGYDLIASLSSRGPVSVDGSQRRKPDITAPGTAIRSSLPGGTYGNKQGTSMASPHVAGAVALLWSARPALKNQIAASEQMLNTSAFHIASSDCSSSGWPNNVYGHGRLDVKAAVDLALSPITWNGQLSADWHTAGNWYPAQVPTATDDVLIPGELPVTATWPALTTTAACYNLSLQAGAQLSLAQGISLSVHGFVSNSGRLKQSQTVNLANGPVTFLALDDGLGGSAYLGLVLSPTADMGNVEVNILGNTCGQSGTLTQTVRRCYDIAPTHAVTALVRFYYRPSEANGNSAPEVYHWDGAAWQQLASLGRGGDGQTWWVEAITDDYSPFALKNPSEPTAARLRRLALAERDGVAWTKLALLAAGALGLGLTWVAARRRLLPG